MFSPPSIPIPATLKGVDDLIRAELEAYRGSCFNWLLAATGLVVIGLVLEGPELWHEITSIWSHWRFERRFHFSLPRGEAPEWVKLWAFAGWLFIVVGVAGEFVADSFVSKADGFVQKFDEILLSDATKAAGDAAQSARIARDEADAATTASSNAQEKADVAERAGSRAKASADDADTRAQTALSHANDAAAKAGKAEASLGKAELEAKNAEASASNALKLAREARQEAASFEGEITRLREQAADRVLDVYEKEQVKRRVFGFFNTPYELAVSNAPEPSALMVQIDEAVSSAGWIYKGSEDTKSFRFIFTLKNGRIAELWSGRGVAIGYSKGMTARFKPAADALAKALREQGIDGAISVTLPDDDPSPNHIHISVGTK